MQIPTDYLKPYVMQPWEVEYDKRWQERRRARAVIFAA